ncbi:hypothetical protein WJ968_20270 [Achromobacter xylosoxidans]
MVGRRDRRNSASKLDFRTVEVSAELLADEVSTTWIVSTSPMRAALRSVPSER